MLGTALTDACSSWHAREGAATEVAEAAVDLAGMDSGEVALVWVVERVVLGRVA